MKKFFGIVTIIISAFAGISFANAAAGADGYPDHVSCVKIVPIAKGLSTVDDLIRSDADMIYSRYSSGSEINFTSDHLIGREIVMALSAFNGRQSIAISCINLAGDDYWREKITKEVNDSMLTVYGNIYTALKNVAQWKIEAEHEVANLDLSGENPKDGVAGIKSVYDKYAKNLNDKSAYVYNRFFNLLLAGKIRKQFMPVDTKNVESPKIQFQDSGTTFSEVMKKTDAIIKTNEDPRRKTDFCVGFKCPIDDVYAFFDIGTGPTPSGSGGYVNIRSLRFDYDGIKVDHCGLEQGRFLCDWNAEEIATVKNVLARPVFTHSGSNVNFYTNTYQNRNTSAEILFSEGQTVLSIEKKDVRKPMSAQMKALHDKIIAFVETKSDGDTRKKQIIISAIKDQIGRIQEKEKNQDKRNEWAGLVESLSLYYSY